MTENKILNKQKPILIDLCDYDKNAIVAYEVIYINDLNDRYNIYVNQHSNGENNIYFVNVFCIKTGKLLVANKEFYMYLLKSDKVMSLNGFSLKNIDYSIESKNDDDDENNNKFYFLIEKNKKYLLTFKDLKETIKITFFDELIKIYNMN